MSHPSTDRRTLLRWLTAGPALAAGTRLLAACSDDTPAAVDVTFAQPWVGLADDEVRDLGRAVRAVDPGALAHARSRLTALDLDAACRLDGDEAVLTAIAGWLMPRTLAGLADALAAS